MVLGVDTE